MLHFVGFVLYITHLDGVVITYVYWARDSWGLQLGFLLLVWSIFCCQVQALRNGLAKGRSWVHWVSRIIGYWCVIMYPWVGVKIMSRKRQPATRRWGGQTCDPVNQTGIDWCPDYLCLLPICLQLFLLLQDFALGRTPDLLATMHLLLLVPFPFWSFTWWV